MKFKLKIVLLSLIILFGFIIRMIFLDLSPPGFNADEAALGYNAYSLLKTGKDEWGQTFPLTFKSFSDYKPGLYVYLDIPFVAIFGLNELAVRLPSILFGTLSIFLAYLLAKEIFKKEIIALSSAFLLAFSPWHVHFSRAAWETNVATFFILAGVLAFLKALRNYRFYYLSFLFFILSAYTYQGARLVAPVLCLVLLLINKKNSFSKKIVYPIVFAIILLIPLGLNLLSNQGLSRFQGISIFSDPGPISKLDQDRGDHVNIHGLIPKLLHNRVVAYIANFSQHYIDHFNPHFLFLNGDPLERNKIPRIGQAFFFEILTIILGIYFLIVRKYNNIKLIVIWLLIAPIASSLTYQTPHALRAHNMVIPLSLISGLGLGELISLIQKYKKPLQILSLTIILLIIIYFLARFLHLYFIHLPKRYGLEWEYGFSQVVPFVFKNKDRYEKIVVTTRYDQPYILFLFYSKFDPKTYQEIKKTEGDNQFGFSTVTNFDNLEFKRFSENDILKSKKTLFIGTEEEVGRQGEFIKEFNFPNGEVAFKIVKSYEE